MTLKPHVIEYRHAGRTWQMTLEAESLEDARARMASAYFNGTRIQLEDFVEMVADSGYGVIEP